MMTFNCAPKFLMCVAVDRVKTMVGQIEVIEDNPCAMGKVTTMNTTKFPGMKNGDLIYFRPQDGTPIRMELGLMHCVVFEECILGWVSADDFDAQLKHVGSLNNPVQPAGKLMNVNGVNMRMPTN